MPCYYEETEEEKNKPWLDKLDKITRIACELANSLEKFHNINAIHGYTFETSEWWKQHKKFDEERERLANEHLRKEALAKLTREERKVLGL